MTAKGVMFMLVLSLSCCSAGAGGKIFANKYCQFELPRGWQCHLKGKEWVCSDKRKGMIVLLAKTRGKEDSMHQYMAILKKKKVSSWQGKNFVSRPQYSKFTKVNGHRWVDARHRESELSGHFTRYMATVKGPLGIIITFSAPMDANVRAKYDRIFDKMIASLRAK